MNEAPSQKGWMLRAAPTLLRVGFSSALAYRAEFLVWILTTNTPLIMLLVWTEVARDEPIGAFGQGEIGAYFLAVLIVRLLTGSWVVWDLVYEIRQGEIGMRLLRPIHPFVSYAAENIAAIPLRALVSLPVAAFALVWLGSEQLSDDPLAWGVFPIAVAGAWLITFFTMAAIGSLGLIWESTLSLYQLWLGMFFIFSGYTVPLAFFPPWLAGTVDWLPFRFLLSFPVEVLLGLVDRREIALGLGVQGAYVVVSFVMAMAIWRAGLRRYAAYGG